MFLTRRSQGGFVAIDMLERALPRILAGILTLTLLACAMAVIWTCAQLGWDNVNSFTARGSSAHDDNLHAGWRITD